MHPNPVFHTQTDKVNLDYARQRAFGVLATCSAQGPLLSHVPFLLDQDDETIWLHLVRSNPIARALKEPLAAKIAVTALLDSLGIFVIKSMKSIRENQFLV